MTEKTTMTTSSADCGDKRDIGPRLTSSVIDLNRRVTEEEEHKHYFKSHLTSWLSVLVTNQLTSRHSRR